MADDASQPDDPLVSPLLEVDSDDGIPYTPPPLAQAVTVATANTTEHMAETLVMEGSLVMSKSDLESAQFTAEQFHDEQPSPGEVQRVDALPMSARIAGSSRMAPIRVVAPMSLEGGYNFVATLSDGRAFVVEVPDGGVTNGQIFTVPYPEEFLATTAIPPMGHWKDGLCDCLNLGLCHPTLCCAFWFNSLAAAQVMTRMKLNWYAEPGTTSQVRTTFKTILLLFFIVLITNALTSALAASLDDKGWIAAIGSTIRLAFGLFTLYLITITRMAVREKYQIRETRCVGCEDCCCAFWCGCCTVSQMMRHTADYETYRGVCCSATGLPARAPIV